MSSHDVTTRRYIQLSISDSTYTHSQIHTFMYNNKSPIGKCLLLNPWLILYNTSSQTKCLDIFLIQVHLDFRPLIGKGCALALWPQAHPLSRLLIIFTSDISISGNLHILPTRSGSVVDQLGREGLESIAESKGPQVGHLAVAGTKHSTHQTQWRYSLV